jgi:site-specific recombinase XerC
MARMKPPTVPEQPLPDDSDADLARRLKTADVKSFVDRRDLAMLRRSIDTGMRRAAIAGLRVEDINFDRQVAYVVGKGGRPRACPFRT